MKRGFALVLVLLLAAPAAAAQRDQQSSSSAGVNANAGSESRAKARQDEVTLDAGSQIHAEMNSTLDLKKAKPGDKFKMKTTRPVKRDGKEIISRGSTVTGHVEQVTRAAGTTRATLIFDQIEDKKTGATASLQAVVTAITKMDSNLPAMSNDDMMSAPAPRTQQSGGQGGGLLGGVVNTVGGVTGQVGSTVDATTRSTTGATAGVGGTAGGLARGTIQIVNDTTASATGGSTLTVADRNAKIENSTQFVLQTTSALTFTGQKK